MNIFAQEFSIPLGFDNWLLNLVCFCALVVMALHGWKLTRPEPTFADQLAKFRDHVHGTFATKAELIENTDMRERTAVEFRDEMREEMKEIKDKLSNRTGEIFEKIRENGEQLAHLEGRLFGKSGGRK